MKTYVAKQPILDREQQIYGYELLYRSGDEMNFYTATNGNQATRLVVSDAVVTIGLDRLVGDSVAFVNFPRAILLSNLPFLLSPEHFIIEVLENVTGDQALLEQLRILKEQGYTLALDDYAGQKDKEQMIHWVDILKVDFALIDRTQRRQIVQRYQGQKILLAEKIETEDDFFQAKEDGYDLFQGYYFSKPIIVSQDIMHIASGTYLRLWQEIQRPEPSLKRIGEMIRQDVSLSYNLFQRINDIAYPGTRPDHVEEVLEYMGPEEVRRWIQLILSRDLFDIGTSDQLVRTSLMRGIFARKMIEQIGYPEYQEIAYTIGLFSAIEESLQIGIEGMRQKGILPEEYQLVLSRQENVLTDLLIFVQNYEAVQGGFVEVFIKKYCLDKKKVALAYVESVAYASTLFEENI